MVWGMKTNALTFSLLLLTACDGGFTSDLKADRRISTLSEYEAVGLCESIASHISTLKTSQEWIEYGCASVAVSDYVYGGCEDERACRQDCNDARFECEGDSDLYGLTYRDFIDCGEIDDYDYEDCGATVSELEACVDEYREAMMIWAEETTCEVGGNWRPSRQLSGGCQAMIQESDCGVFIYGD